MSQSSVWTKDRVLNLIATNDLALARALIVINNNQTADEQAALKTIESNGKGFNGRDAHVLGDIARKLPRYDNRMTERQRAYVRKALPKYWRQLLRDIEAKGLPVDWGNGIEPDNGNGAEIGQEKAAEQFGAWS